jgi:hypothetical protein
LGLLLFTSSWIFLFSELFVLIGKFHGSALVEELQGQHAVLRDCIEQLMAVESSRTSLVSHLKEALQEQVGWPDYSIVTLFLSK